MTLATERGPCTFPGARAPQKPGSSARLGLPEMSIAEGAPAFIDAVFEVVNQRIDVGSGNIGVRSLISLRVELAGRISPLLPAELIVVLEGVEAGRLHVRITCKVSVG